MSIEVIDWSPGWASQLEAVAAVLRDAVTGVPGARVEHVGSTSVPGLAAKPILDIDVMREVLRSRDDLRDAYAGVKRALADEPAMDIAAHLAGKSAVLQRVLAASGEVQRGGARRDPSAQRRLTPGRRLVSRRCQTVIDSRRDMRWRPAC